MYPARRHILAALILAVLAAPVTSHARVWRILPDGTGDAPTIQAGVDSALAGDVVEIACGEYFEHDIDLKSGITVRGESSEAGCAVLDLGDAGRGFNCNTQSDVVLEHLTIRNGDATYGAGIFCLYASLIVRDCEFSGGDAYGDGAITSYGSDLELLRCRFLDNFSFNEGAGAIWFRNSTATVTDCLFADNVADDGGGAVWVYESDVEFTRCIFVGNQALGNLGPAWGAAILVESTAPEPCRVLDCTIVANTGDNAVYASSVAGLTMANTIVAFNNGAALLAGETSDLALTCCDIFGNTGGDWTGTIAPLLGLDGNITLDPLFCDQANRDFSLREGSPCLPEGNLECGQIGAFPLGCPEPLGIPGVRSGAGALEFRPATPNPFNPRTILHFELPESGPVQLAAYDVKGRLVDVLVDRWLPAGPRSVEWEAVDQNGRPLASGVYLVKLLQGNNMALQQVTLVR